MIADCQNPPLHREEAAVDANGKSDPVLAMLGVGKQLWESEQGESFVARLRSEGLGDSSF